MQSTWKFRLKCGSALHNINLSEFRCGGCQHHGRNNFPRQTSLLHSISSLSSITTAVDLFRRSLIVSRYNIEDAITGANIKDKWKHRGQAGSAVQVYTNPVLGQDSPVEAEEAYFNPEFGQAFLAEANNGILRMAKDHCTAFAKNDIGYCCMLQWPKSEIVDPDVVHGLCVMCLRMLDHGPLIYQHDKKHWTRLRIDHWSTYLSLNSAPESGCLLYRKLVLCWKDKYPPNNRGCRNRSGTSQETPENVVIELKSMSSDEKGYSLYLISNRQQVELRCHMVNVPEPSILAYVPFGHSRERFMLSCAVDWFKACFMHHKLCNQRRSSGKLPTRLLEVKSSACRLRITSKLPEKTRYATLSHCWGGKIRLRLEKDSYGKFLAGISERTLPKTFKDAVAITQHLELEYLWIDSLCIIQDDKDDWRKESVTMSDVNGHSSVTIAASDGPNSQAGCFPELRPSYESLRMSIRTQDAKIVHFEGWKL